MPQNDVGTPVDPEAAEVAHQEVPTPDSAPEPTDTGVLEEQPGQNEGSAVGDSQPTDEGMLPTRLLTGGAYVGN